MAGASCFVLRVLGSAAVVFWVDGAGAPFDRTPEVTCGSVVVAGAFKSRLSDVGLPGTVVVDGVVPRVVVVGCDVVVVVGFTSRRSDVVFGGFFA